MAGTRMPRSTGVAMVDGAPVRAITATALVLGALLLFAALAGPSQAQQNLDVTRFDDPAPDGCVSGSDCSLREAVIDANGDTSQAATIDLEAGTYNLTISGTSGDATDGDLVVTSDITVEGAGVDDTAIDATGLNHRVFRVAGDVDVPGSLTLEDTTILGGDALASDATVNRGGGIYVQTEGGPASVTVLRSRVESNTARLGGGVAVDGVEGEAVATIVRSALTDNHGEVGGGGLWVAGVGDRGIGQATVEQSVIDTNDALPEGFGGGVLIEGGEVDLTNTTVSGNTAGFGGGVLNDDGPNGSPTGVLTLTHATIARNTADSDGAANAIQNPAESVTARATIVGENPTPGATPNCTDGPIDSLGQNLEDADTCGFGDSTDAPNTAPDLDDLAQNAPEDAPTRTHALPATSPAVDYYTGAADDCDVAEDQREVSRPQDGDGDGTAACDIGAFELQGEPEADVMVTKAATGTVSVGDEFDYIVEVTNNGPDAAADVTLTENLPAHVSVVAIDPASDCAETSTNVVECDLGTVASGDTVTVTITVTADAPTSSATNTAEVTSTTPDPDEGNNTDRADVMISEQPFNCVPENTADPLPEGVSRLSGPERIATAIEISRESCPDGGANAVVLTRADIFPDALSGTPLATQEDAPILFSNTDQLTPASQAELQRVLPAGNTVYLLGQTAALSTQVENQVAALGYNTVRIGGANRFGTAAEIADRGLNDPDTLLIADGANFPDAISGASGEAVGGAVLLTAGQTMPSETQAYLNGRTDDPDLFAIGGPASQAEPSATSVVGATRFHTSVEVAEQFFSSPSAVGIATGGEFADALAGGALMGRLGGPMLLTTRDDLPQVVEDYLETHAATIDRAIVFGGTAVVSPTVESQVDAAITP